MEPEFLADEPLLTGKKAHAVREARAPMTQLAWLFAVAFIGFSVTSAAIWFGPRAVQYIREVAESFSGVASKSGPRTMPDFKPFWVSDQPPVFNPQSIPQFNIPQGNAFPAPSTGNGVNSSRFTIQR